MENFLLFFSKNPNALDLNNIFNTLQPLIIILYLIVSLILAVKVFKDSNKRFNDKYFVAIITIFAFCFNIVGYFVYSIFKPKEFIHDQKMHNMEKYFLEYETRGIGKCKVCKFVYFPEHTYCVNCGNLVRTKCSCCSNIIELDWKVCPYCGDNKTINYEKNHISISNNSVKGIEIVKQ